MSLFEVGPHKIRTACHRWRWSTTVDGKPLPGWFMTEADAWTAGIHALDRLDRDRTGRVWGEPGPLPGVAASAGGA